MELTFAQVDGALARIHSIRPDKRAAFTARLQHLQKMRFPAGTNTGRGRRATYGVSHVLLLSLAIELGQFGLTPERSKGLIEANERIVRAAFALAVEAQDADREANGPAVISFDPNVLQSLVSPVEDDLWLRGSFNWGRLSEATQYFADRARSGMSRLAIFSVSDLLLDLADQLAATDGERTAFFDAVAEWAGMDPAA